MKDFSYHDFFNKKGVFRSLDTNGFLLGCEIENDFVFTGDHTKPWVNYILDHFGMITTELFPNAEVYEYFFNRDDKTTYEQKLYEIKNN